MRTQNPEPTVGGGGGELLKIENPEPTVRGGGVEG